MSTSSSLSPCVKCNGTGYIGIYSHIEGGMCFACRGTGVMPEKVTIKAGYDKPYSGGSQAVLIVSSEGVALVDPPAKYSGKLHFNSGTVDFEYRSKSELIDAVNVALRKGLAQGYEVVSFWMYNEQGDSAFFTYNSDRGRLNLSKVIPA
jgi:hypothetical protein